jgi:phosphate starvation-inducible membrane PsiE
MEQPLAWEKHVNTLGAHAVKLFHYLALFVIGAATVWSGVFAFWGMVGKGAASIHDLLLLFIYLELGAMVGIYFTTNHMPVRFLIYIAITALTRHMVEIISEGHALEIGMLWVTLSIFLLALANLVIRFASARYPSALRAPAFESERSANLTNSELKT